MNLFQWLTTPVLSGLVALELRAYIKNRQAVHLFRLTIWMVGIGLILLPGVASIIADLLGIGRGTDLVLYAFMLFTTGGLFYLYGRNLLLQRDVVELARRDAFRGATRGEGTTRQQEEPPGDRTANGGDP
ncbi:MAG: DUF2304 domain-containing protein [Planctomycetota bacterium]